MLTLKTKQVDNNQISVFKIFFVWCLKKAKSNLPILMPPAYFLYIG